MFLTPDTKIIHVHVKDMGKTKIGRRKKIWPIILPAPVATNEISVCCFLMLLLWKLVQSYAHPYLLLKFWKEKKRCHYMLTSVSLKTPGIKYKTVNSAFLLKGTFLKVCPMEH